MADNKMMMFAAVGIVVGLLIGVGVGYAVFNSSSSSNDADETYYFYLNFGDEDVRTKWYSASGANADEALAKALDGTEIKINYGKSGYPSFTESSWGQFVYTYNDTDKLACDGSTVYAQYDSYGGFIKSNGWSAVAGYDGPGIAKKMFEFKGTIFYFAPYADDYSIVDPTESTLWKTANGTPFA